MDAGQCLNLLLGLGEGTISYGLMTKLAWEPITSNMNWGNGNIWANWQHTKMLPKPPPPRKRASLFIPLLSTHYDRVKMRDQFPITLVEQSCSSELSAPGTHSYQTKSPGSPLEAALGWLQDILTESQTTEWTNTDILLRRCVWEEWNLGSITLLEGSFDGDDYVQGSLFWQAEQEGKSPRSLDIYVHVHICTVCERESSASMAWKI